MLRLSLERAVRLRIARPAYVLFAFTAFAAPLASLAQTGFDGVPASAAKTANPVAAQPAAIQQGAVLFSTNCANCHGATGQGNGNIPGLATDKVRQAKDGELFWFITHGSVNNGMPAWDKLTEAERWQLVSLLKSGDVAKAS